MTNTDLNEKPSWLELLRRWAIKRLGGVDKSAYLEKQEELVKSEESREIALHLATYFSTRCDVMKFKYEPRWIEMFPSQEVPQGHVRVKEFHGPVLPDSFTRFQL